jgi:hypothetical protein
LEALGQNQKPSLQLDALGRTHFKKLKCQSALFDKHRGTPAWRWLSLLLSHLFSTSDSASYQEQAEGPWTLYQKAKPAPKEWVLIRETRPGYGDQYDGIKYMSERDCEWARERELTTKKIPAHKLGCLIEFSE